MMNASDIWYGGNIRFSQSHQPLYIFVRRIMISCVPISFPKASSKLFTSTACVSNIAKMLTFCIMYMLLPVAQPRPCKNLKVWSSSPITLMISRPTTWEWDPFITTYVVLYGKWSSRAICDCFKPISSFDCSVWWLTQLAHFIFSMALKAWT